MTKFIMLEDGDAAAIANLARIVEEAGKNKIRLEPLTAANLKGTILEILRVLYASDPAITQERITEGETFRLVRTNGKHKASFRIKIVRER